MPFLVLQVVTNSRLVSVPEKINQYLEGLCLLISLFSPEPGNWEMGGLELGNPGFGFGFSMSHRKTISRKFSS